MVSILDIVKGDAIAPYQDYLSAGVQLDYSTILLPNVMARPHTKSGKGTFLHFEGRKHARGFRGEHITETWNYTILFAIYERHLAVALDELLEEQFDAADGRCVIRRETVEGTKFDVVEIHEWVDTPQGGGVSQFTFTATRTDDE